MKNPPLSNISTKTGAVLEGQQPRLLAIKLLLVYVQKAEALKISANLIAISQ